MDRFPQCWWSIHLLLTVCCQSTYKPRSYFM